MELYFLHFEVDTPVQYNFGGEFYFEYNKETKELLIEPNGKFIPNLFSPHVFNGKSNQAIVSKITGVIGANGAGKSRLLYHILHTFIRGVSHISIPIVVALCDNEGNKIIYCFNDETPIKKGNWQKHGFALKELSGLKDNIGPDIPTELRNTDFIFVSTAFDHQYWAQLDGGINLSTNFLIKNDKNERAEFGMAVDGRSEVDLHYLEEIGRQVYFTTDYQDYKNYIPFDLPEELVFRPKEGRDFVSNDFSLNLPSRMKPEENPNMDFIRAFRKRAKDFISTSNDNKSNTLANFVTNCIINFLLEVFTGLIPANANIENPATLISQGLHGFTFSDNFLDDIYKVLDILKTRANKATPHMDSVLLEIIDSIGRYYDFLDKNLSETNRLNKSGLVFTVKTGHRVGPIKDLLLLYRSTFLFAGHLDFNWRKLSSGETALLQLYARLYTLADTQRAGRHLQKDLVIMFDEPDIYMHPALSQKLVQSFIDFLTDIYTATDPHTTRKMHIILTSNSPFIAADIPVSNIIFLKAEGNGESKIGQSLDARKQKETFGANIHTILSDSFFLPFSSLGKFAENKMNYIIKGLTSGSNISEEQSKDLLKMIDIIGEPVIRRRLLQMYSDRYNLTLEKRIKKMEEEIEKLKREGQ